MSSRTRARPGIYKEQVGRRVSRRNHRDLVDRSRMLLLNWPLRFRVRVGTYPLAFTDCYLACTSITTAYMVNPRH